MITRMAKNEMIMKRKVERERIIDTFVCGNIADFKFWLNKVANKNDILEGIRYYGANYDECYKMLNFMSMCLEEK